MGIVNENFLKSFSYYYGKNEKCSRIECPDADDDQKGIALVKVAVSLKCIIQVYAYAVFGYFKQQGIDRCRKQCHPWLHAFLAYITEQYIEKEKGEKYGYDNIQKLIHPAEFKNHIGKWQSNLIKGDQ